jgi:hypothetical protein
VRSAPLVDRPAYPGLRAHYPGRPSLTSSSTTAALSLDRLASAYGLATVLRALLRAFGRRRLPHALPMAEWAAFGPRLSLAPGLIRGRPLAHRAVASSRASEGRPAVLDHGLDRQLDHKPPIASSSAAGRRPLSAARPAYLSPTAIRG